MGDACDERSLPRKRKREKTKGGREGEALDLGDARMFLCTMVGGSMVDGRWWVETKRVVLYKGN